MNVEGSGWRCSSRAAQDFIEDDCPTQAAALSYYTIFSLPPLLMLLLMILGTLVDPQDIRGQLEVQMGALMGPTATEQIRTILAQAAPARFGSAVANCAQHRSPWCSARRGRSASCRPR